MIRNVTLSDIVRSVTSRDGAASIPKPQIEQIVDFALRQVIGFNCLTGDVLHIDLDNERTLSCKLEAPKKRWSAWCSSCGQVEILQKTKPTSCKNVFSVGAASTRLCGNRLEHQEQA